MPRNRRMQVLVELMATAKGQLLTEQLEAKRCGFESGCLRLTLVSTERIRNYFMVHSAFVPGVTSLYDKLLGARGQEIVRLEVPEGGTGAPVTLAALQEALVPRGAIPFALVLDDDTVRMSPPAHEPIDPATVRGIFALADTDRLPTTFRPPAAREAPRDSPSVPPHDELT